MSDYGLTTLGFSLKRLINIQEDLVSEMKTTFGEIDTSADSVFGQLIGVLSKPLTDLWEQMENVYFSQYPDTATGAPLDYSVALTGITRRPATSSYGTIGLKGNDGTIVPANTQVSTKVTNYLFQTKAEATITLTDVTSIIINIDEATESSVYTVNVNGTDYYYTAAHGESVSTIASKLKTDVTHGLINCSLINVTDNNNGSLLIETKSALLTFVVTGTTTDIISWWTPVTVVALDKGAIPAPENTITIIVNAVSGLDAVNNFTNIDAETGMGKDIESDNALRLRRLSSLKVAGAASVEAIRARILSDVENVTACIVLENPTDGVVDSLDPHSIKIIVEGGLDLDIGKMIWAVKAGGVKVMGGAGSTSVSFTDSQGNLQTISFFRPTPKYAWVDVVISDYDPLLIPVGYAVQIRDNILPWGTEHTINQEIVYQQLFGVVYQVPGILQAKIKIALTNAPDDPPSWVTDNIAMPNKTCYPEFDLSRINVT